MTDLVLKRVSVRVHDVGIGSFGERQETTPNSPSMEGGPRGAYGEPPPKLDKVRSGKLRLPVGPHSVVQVKNSKGGESQNVVALFPGSFDPPTSAHLAFAKAISQLNLTIDGDEQQPQEVRFLPVYEHADPDKRKYLRPFHERKGMLESAIGEELGSSFRVETVDQELEGVSDPTRTIEELRRREPGTRFVLFFGADLKPIFDSPKFERLRKIADIVYVARPGYGTEGAIELDMPHASSTAIREALAWGDEEVLDTSLSTAVRKWLQERPHVTTAYVKRYVAQNPEQALAILEVARAKKRMLTHSLQSIR